MRISRIVFAILIAATAFAEPIATWDFKLPDTAGKIHTIAEWKDKPGVVLLFVSTECPVSNRYAPTINALVQEYLKKNIPFYLIQSDPAVTAIAAKKHAQEYKFQSTILMDGGQWMAKKMGVTTAPTAVLVTRNAQVLYKGRIDDRAIELGKYRDAPTREDLRVALNSVLTGQAVLVPGTPVVGCFLPPAKP